MGAGASAENARTTVAHLLTGKPADASDITVIFLNSYTSFFLDNLFKGPRTSSCRNSKST